MRRFTFAVGLLIVSATGGTAALAGPAAHRATIEVYPGPNAVNDALAIANDGDTLNIHGGTYPEQVRVSTPNLTLQAAGDGVAIVDGGCAANTTLAIRAEGVTIEGLHVTGAANGFEPHEIDFSYVTTGSVIDTVEIDTCNAQYGINLFEAGSINVIGNFTSGFSDSGIYVGFITSTPHGPLVVRGNTSDGNERGIIVEDISGGTVRVLANHASNNQTSGIYLTGSTGVVVGNNRVLDNGTSGIELDPFSDHNLIRSNRAKGHQYDLANDGGSGNCWMDNVYTTSFGTISC